MKQRMDTAKAIRAVDDLLAGVGLAHGRRLIRQGSLRSHRQEDDLRGEVPQPGLATHVHGGASVLRVPQWVEAGVPHAFSTRLGGYSTVYRRDGKRKGEINLGLTASDEPGLVEWNRKLLRKAAGAGDRALITLKQIHSSLTRRVTAADEDCNMRADGLMTNDPRVVLGIQTADCVPVLVRDRRRGAVAAFHAGWRGTLKRIVEGGIGRMRLEFGSEPAELEAAIGPAIGACCYAVGEEVRSEFLSQFSYAPALFCEVYDSDPVKEKYPLLFLTARAPGHSNIGPSLHLDLAEANRQQLLDAGVPAEQITMAHRCTSCEPETFFSYRAEQGYCGRMMALIGV